MAHQVEPICNRPVELAYRNQAMETVLPIRVHEDCNARGNHLRLVPFQLEFNFSKWGCISKKRTSVVTVTGFNSLARYHIDGALMNFVLYDHPVPEYRRYRRAYRRMVDRMTSDGLTYLGEMVLLPEQQVLNYLRGNKQALEKLKLALRRVDLRFADRIPKWTPPNGDPDNPHEMTR